MTQIKQLAASPHASIATSRIWMGVGLLAVSWLFGPGLYQPENWFCWAAAVGLGTVLFYSNGLRLPSARRCLASMVLLLPAVWVLPMPFKAGPLLVAVGLGLTIVPISRHWPQRLGNAAVAAGAVLVSQSAVVWAYTGLTARWHDLPWPLVSLLGLVVRLTGVEAAVDGSTLSLRAAGNVHRLGATWDLLLDPATLCFLVGGWAMLGMLAGGRYFQQSATGCLPASDGHGVHICLRRAALLTGVVLAWLPVRAALLITLYVGRVSLADTGWPLTVMEQFISPWPSLLLLGGLTMLTARFVLVPNREPTEPLADVAPLAPCKPWAYPLGLALVAVSVAVVCAGWSWEPVGSRKQGRVMFVEKHSLWEPSNAAYDKRSYGEPASYTYSLIYDYCSHFMQMSRLLESESIDADRLADCDVLILKTPTARFSGDEVKAISRFVKRGGGLLLIGDHTNVFNSSTYLNDVTREFGFTFETDLLFHVGRPYEQAYRPAFVPHASVCHLDKFDFAVSCSIDPGTSSGRAVIQSGGLWSLPSEYSYSNFHPASEYQPEMRCGSFIQLWTTRHGSGRVAAFADSTIFSNFCVFQPGKAELFLGMVEWLNHQGPLNGGWKWLTVAVLVGLLGIVFFVMGARLVRRTAGGWIGILAAGLFGLTMAGIAVAATHRSAMPWPSPATPLKQIIVDRQVSQVPLSKGAYATAEGIDEGQGFGLLEQWIPRVGYFTARRRGAEVTSGDGLLVICPSGSVDEAYRRRLIEYVEGGGRLLVLDSPSNYASTANSLLWPFGLSLARPVGPVAGTLTSADGQAWPGAEIGSAWTITGGQPLVLIDGAPVAAQAQFGRGTVTVVGFAAAFNDAAMGVNWMQEPDAAMLAHYDLLFKLLESAFEGKEQQ